MPQLPVVGQAPPLRADAARNRALILAAAANLFAEHGVDGVSLDDVVAAAGVGKGTLFRAFGDKAGLAAALLDDVERELQRRILTGRPPLGPGASPSDRACAFVRAYVDYVRTNVALVAMSQTARAGARFDTGSHQFWHLHLMRQFEAAGTANPAFAADVVLAAATAEQVGQWMQSGVSARQLREWFLGLVRLLLPEPPTAAGS